MTPDVPTLRRFAITYDNATMKHSADQFARLLEAMTRRGPKVRSAEETARLAELSRRGILRALLDARRDSGLTPATVARSMKVPASAVARLEGGNHNPTLKTLALYAAAVGASVVIQPPPRVARDWYKLRPEDLDGPPQHRDARPRPR